jgi:LPPG:FO 2-phospho-L-lactate transferase
MGDIVVLSGGIGGAKLVNGLAKCTEPSRLCVFVNTGDDFDHVGLRVCPDLDTTVYTLSGLADRERGWGRAGESWAFMSALEALGGPGWFQLGDQDLALNVLRTYALRTGQSLSDFSERLCRHLGIVAHVLPASDDPVRTQILTTDGWLPFQDYFVRLRCEPSVREIQYGGADRAVPHPLLIEKLLSADTAAIILAPSNPWLSIGPILALPGVRSALFNSRAPVIAVTPIIQGDAVKGPAAKIMRELGLEVCAGSVADLYRDFLDGFVLDVRDAQLEAGIDLPVFVTNTLMESDQDRQHLAQELMEFARSLAKRNKKESET